jgi:hypothetical protein
MSFAVDWAIGPSKTNAVNYYIDILNMLKQLLGNSPHIIHVVDYLRHIPLITKHDHINSFIPYNYENNCIPIEIKNSGFIKDFIRLCYSKYLEPYQWNKQDTVFIPNEIIFYLFSKYNSKDLPLALNIPYKLSSLNIANNSNCKLLNDYYIIIRPNNKQMMFEYNFDIIIRKYSNSHNVNFNNMLKILSYKHFIDNLYYTINFSNSISFSGKYTDWLPKYFRDTISNMFPNFSNTKYHKSTIVIDSKTKTLKVIKEKIYPPFLPVNNVFITKIHPSINNLFKYYSVLIFKHKYHKSYSNFMNSCIEIELGIGY